MTGPAAEWRTALAAAAAVQAGAGLLTAAALNASGDGHNVTAVFIACAAVAGVTEVALVQGWLWVPGRLDWRKVLMRTAVAACGLGLAAVAGFVGAFCAPPLAGLLAPDLVLDGIFAGALLVAGAATGLSPLVAARWDDRPGVVRARLAAHAAAGVVGVGLVTGLATLATATEPVPWQHSSRWWGLLGLLPAVLVAAGLVHGGLVARWHGAGARLPPPDLVWRRAAVCTACCAGLAGLLLAAGWLWFPLDGVVE